MAETRVVVTADVDQAVVEFYRLRSSASGSLQQVAQAGEQLNRAGISARQMSAAMAGLPAQISDVVVSLQGGQGLLTVALQQGSQIVGQFGSMGTALRGVSSYVLGLVTPFTVAAAAGSVFAVAFYKGRQESEEFRKTLALTGNAAGVTTSELVGMSAAVARSADDTKARGAAAVAQLLDTGRVGRDNLQLLATATVLAEKDIGIAVRDTVSTFEDLAKSPLQASEKLSEKYHYLTLATYEQIKALQDQGRADDAARMAQSAYAEAISQRAKDVDASLGYLTKGWNAAGAAARKAWDWMLDVGREDTLEEKIQKAQAALEQARPKRFSFIGAGEYREAEALVQSLTAQKDAKERMAAIDAGRAQLQEAGIAWDKEGEKFLSRREQLERDIVASRNKGLAAGASDAEIAKREAEIRKQYSDIFNAGIDSQIEAIKRRGAIEDAVSARSMSALATAREAGLAASLQAQEEYATAAAAIDQAQYSREEKRLEKELKLTAQKANSEKDQAALSGQIDDVRERKITRRLDLENELFKLEVNATRAAANTVADSLDKRDAELRTISEQIQAQRDQNAVIGLGKREVAAYTAALVEERARRLESDAAIADTILGREAEADKLRQSAQALRELTTAQAEGAARTMDFERQRTIWQGIGSTSHDTFLSIEQDGKGAFDRLYGTLKNGLLELLYQMTAKQWIMNIGAQVTGYSALAPTGAGSTVGGAINGASSVSSLYNVASNGFSGSVGTGIATAGNFVGSSSLSAFGAGFASAGGEAMTAAETFGAAGMAAEASAASLGAAVSVAIPYVAAAIVAYKAFNALFDDGPESDTRLTFGSNNKAGNISINERGNEGKSDTYIAGASTSSAFGTFGVTSTFWAPAESETVQKFVKTVGLADDALAKYLTTTEKANVTSYLTTQSSTAHVGAEGQITSAEAGAALAQVFNDRMMDILDGVEPGLAKLEAGFQGTSAELATEVESLLAYRSALRDSGEAVFGAKVTLQQIAALKTPTEATSAALVRIANEFTATNQVATLLGKDVATAFGSAGLASEAMRAQIILLTGGLDKFNSLANSFAQNYFTDAERLAPVAKQLDAQLAALGLSTIPQTKQQFRDLVVGLNLSSESGQKLYAGLMALQEQFAQVHASEESAADTLRERAELQNKLDELTMSQEQLAAKARAAIDGHNLALYDQVVAAQAAKDAADAARSAADTLAGVNKGYQDQIDALLKANMSAAQIRALETAGMDASTLALYDRLAGLKASADAEKAATAAIAKAQVDSAAVVQGFGNAMQGTIDKITSATKALQDFSAQINAGDLSPLSAEAKYSTSKAAVAAASPDNAQAAVTTFLQSAKDHAATRLEYQRDVAYAQSVLQSLIDSKDASIAATVASYSGMIRAMSAVKIGAHATGGIASGWSLVGEQGPELVNFSTPGRVYTASQSREMMGGGSNTAALQSEVQQMRIELKAALEAVAINTSATTRLLNRVVVNDVLQAETPE